MAERSGKISGQAAIEFVIMLVLAAILALALLALFVALAANGDRMIDLAGHNLP